MCDKSKALAEAGPRVAPEIESGAFDVEEPVDG